MLDVKRMGVLAAVARHGSMTGAAAALAFTPSAVSQQIATLERQAGVPLVTRHPRGVVLTDAGRLLAEHAEAVAERLERAEAELADLVGLRAGRLRMGAFASAGSRLLPDAIGRFRRAHPDVVMTLEIREPVIESPDLVRDGEIDLTVVFDHVPGDTMDVAGLTRVWLADDEMNVALPVDHPLATETGPLHIGELRGEAWIRDSGPVCCEQLKRLAATAGYAPTIAFDSDDYPTVGRLVASGVGVALIPGLAADQMESGVALRPVRPASVRRICAIAAARPSPATQAMLDILAAGAPGSAVTSPSGPEPVPSRPVAGPVAGSADAGRVVAGR